MIDKCYQPIHYFEGFGEVVHYFEIYVFTHCFLYIICRYNTGKRAACYVCSMPQIIIYPTFLPLETQKRKSEYLKCNVCKIKLHFSSCQSLFNSLWIKVLQLSSITTDGLLATSSPRILQHYNKEVLICEQMP